MTDLEKIIKILSDIPTADAESVLENVKDFVAQRRQDDDNREKQDKLGWQRRLHEAGITEQIPGVDGFYISLSKWLTNQRNLIQSVWNIDPDVRFIERHAHEGYPGYVDVLRKKDKVTP